MSIFVSISIYIYRERESEREREREKEREREICVVLLNDSQILWHKIVGDHESENGRHTRRGRRIIYQHRAHETSLFWTACYAPLASSLHARPRLARCPAHVNAGVEARHCNAANRTSKLEEKHKRRILSFTKTRSLQRYRYPSLSDIAPPRLLPPSLPVMTLLPPSLPSAATLPAFLLPIPTPPPSLYPHLPSRSLLVPSRAPLWLIACFPVGVGSARARLPTDLQPPRALPSASACHNAPQLTSMPPTTPELQQQTVLTFCAHFCSWKIEWTVNNVNAYVYAYVCVYEYAHVYECVYVHVYMYMYMYMYIYMYMYMYMYMYI